MTEKPRPPAPPVPGAPASGLAVLYAVLRCGGFRCAIDALTIGGFDAAGDDEPSLSLATCLGLRSQVVGEGRAAEHVHIAGSDRPLLVDEVEGIVDPGESGVLALPALTRLIHPIFRGVLNLPGERLVPVLDLAEIRKLDAKLQA